MSKKARHPLPPEKKTDERRALAAHPPAKNRGLLIASIVLFALWFVFLAYTALFPPP
jgi:hypothetical protein